MDPLVCRLQRLMPRTRSSWVSARSRWDAPGGSWTCLELDDQLPGLALRTAHELVVRRPAALTLAVLAAAPELHSVVLPEHCRLPTPVTAELARRQIAIVWRQLPEPAGEPVLELARPGVTCPMPRRRSVMTRRGSMP